MCYSRNAVGLEYFDGQPMTLPTAEHEATAIGVDCPFLAILGGLRAFHR